MTFEEVFLSITASVGGMGALIWLLVKAISKYVVDNLNKQYQLKLDKELETHKKELEKEVAVTNSVLSNKTYISQAKFDVELQTYRSLSRAFMVMTKTCSFLFSDDHYFFDNTRANEYWVKKSIDAIRAVDCAQDVLYQNTAFISEELYSAYEVILGKCQDLVTSLEYLVHNGNCEVNEQQKPQFVVDKKAEVKIILDEQDKVNSQLRSYLSNLVIL